MAALQVDDIWEVRLISAGMEVREGGISWNTESKLLIHLSILEKGRIKSSNISRPLKSEYLASHQAMEMKPYKFLIKRHSIYLKKNPLDRLKWKLQHKDPQTESTTCMISNYFPS